jgi:hypothetical protein
LDSVEIKGEGTCKIFGDVFQMEDWEMRSTHTSIWGDIIEYILGLIYRGFSSYLKKESEVEEVKNKSILIQRPSVSLFSGFYVGTMLVNIFMQLYLMHRMRTQLH